jgi:hypothetical protein
MRSYRLAWLAVVFALLPAFASAQSVPAKYLPKETELVFTLNFQQLLNSQQAKEQKELVKQLQFLLDNKLTEVGAQKYLDKAGLDLFRDVGSVSLVGQVTQQGDKVLLVAEGKFSPDKLQAAAEDAARDNPGSLNITKIDDQRVYEVPTPDGKTVYISPVGSSALVAATSKDLFTAMLSQLKSGREPMLTKSVQSLLKTTNTQQSLSFVVTGAEMVRIAQHIPNVNSNEQILEVLKNLDGLSIAFTLAKDLKFQIGITAANKETADDLSNKANGGLIFGRTLIEAQAKKDPKLIPAVEIVNSLRVAAEGNNVLVRGEISYENLGKIVKEIQKKQKNKNQ